MYAERNLLKKITEKITAPQQTLALKKNIFKSYYLSNKNKQTKQKNLSWSHTQEVSTSI